MLHLAKRHRRSLSDICKAIFVRHKFIAISVISGYFKLSACVEVSNDPLIVIVVLLPMWV